MSINIYFLIEAFIHEVSPKAVVVLVNTMPAANVLAQRIIARIVKATAKYGIPLKYTRVLEQTKCILDGVKNSLIEHGGVSIFTGVMNQTKDDFVLAEIVDVLAILTEHGKLFRNCAFLTDLVFRANSESNYCLWSYLANCRFTRVALV